MLLVWPWSFLAAMNPCHCKSCHAKRWQRFWLKACLFIGLCRPNVQNEIMGINRSSVYHQCGICTSWYIWDVTVGRNVIILHRIYSSCILCTVKFVYSSFELTCCRSFVLYACLRPKALLSPTMSVTEATITDVTYLPGWKEGPQIIIDMPMLLGPTRVNASQGFTNEGWLLNRLSHHASLEYSLLCIQWNIKCFQWTTHSSTLKDNDNGTMGFVSSIWYNGFVSSITSYSVCSFSLSKQEYQSILI